jgi:hypothetical protein
MTNTTGTTVQAVALSNDNHHTWASKAHTTEKGRIKAN